MAAIGPVAECPHCRHSNPSGSVLCANCNTPISEDTIMATEMATELGPEELTASGATDSIPAGILLEPGTVLGDRYEILQMLGRGGMGAVYRARDRELDRLVALKVIRPELANNPKIIDRFKQELILARQVTHKNVIRVFDLGVAGGIKFITMEFIEGRDLSSIVAERKFTHEESTRIIQQVCRALDAAHSEGVVHRDLKPQNIMMDEQGRASVMDFGLALSAGAAKAGGLAGTPAYMSPEQARNAEVDHRSDIFTLGIIYYELLTGQLPFKADSIVESLKKRTEEPAQPVIELDPSVPKAMSDVVEKCMAVDPADRYQSSAELLHELDVLTGDYKPVSPFWKRAATAVGILLVALVVGGIVFRDRLLKPPEKIKPVTVLVADFDNATGDPVFGGTLEPAFNVALEGASFITAYKRVQALQIAQKLKPGSTGLGEALARLVAVREGVSVVVTGSIVREGDRYRIAVKALDAVTGKPLVERDAGSLRKDAVLAEVGRLSAPIRRELGDTTPASAQISAAETFTTSSLEAAHAYSLAQDHLDRGQSEDAMGYYQQAVQLDPKLGRAYAGLAVAALNLKKREEAGQFYKKTLTVLDRMSERERYRTLGTYYAAFQRNYAQAIGAYRKLVAAFPGDGSGWNNLGICYVFTLNIPEAVSASRHALEINPRSLQYRLNAAMYAMFAADFKTAISEAQRILKENPSYEFAYLPLTLSTLASGDVPGARAIYDRLAKTSPEGYSMAKMGEADLEMHLGRYREALAPLKDGIAADTEANRTGELAFKYVAESEARLALGQKAQAVALAGKAAGMFRVESVLLPAARILLQAGQEAKALEIAEALENMLQPQTRSYARLITGEIALRRNKLPEAVTTLQEGQKLHNSWLSHFLLGRAYLEAGHFAEALGEFEACRQRRGESTDLFFADTTTLRYLPVIYYWLGRSQEGLGMMEAAQKNYQEFLNLRQQANPGDPLVKDARRRVKEAAAA